MIIIICDTVLLFFVFTPTDQMRRCAVKPNQFGIEVNKITDVLCTEQTGETWIHVLVCLNGKKITINKSHEVNQLIVYIMF